MEFLKHEQVWLFQMWETSVWFTTKCLYEKSLCVVILDAKKNSVLKETKIKTV